MRKVILFMMWVAFACLCAQAAGPLSRAEAASLIREGKARKAPLTFRQPAENGSFFDRYDRKTVHRLSEASKNKTPLAGTPRKSVGNTTVGGSSILGWQSASFAEGFFPGLYTLTDDGGYQLMWKDTSYFELEENTMKTGWLHNGKICGYVFDMYYGYVFGLWYQEMSLSGGEVLKRETLDLSSSQQFTVCAYRPSDNTVYGYGLCDESYYYAFFKVDPSAPGDYELVRTIDNSDLCYAMCYNPVDDTMYGVTIRQKFVKINYDGTQETLFTLPYDDLAYYIAGMVYSPVENVFFMNVNYSSTGKSAFIKISTDGNVETYQDLQYGESFNMLFTTDENVRPDSPGRPVLTDICFNGGDTSGYSVYRLPSQKVNGEKIEGRLSAVASVDSEPYLTYSDLEPGSDLRVEYRDLTPGRHYFSFHVMDGEYPSGSVSNEKYIGNDVPKAPTGLVLTADSLRWNAVTESVHGGFLDLPELKYAVYIDGEQYALTPDTCIAVSLPSDRIQQKYAATVVATCHGMESEAVVSNKVLWGEAYTLPVHIYPTQEQADLCTVFDGNHDNQGWYHSAISHDFRIGYTSAGEGNVDDWVFLPYIRLDNAGTLYHFTYDAGLFTSQFLEESIEIFAGKSNTPEAMTVPIVKEFCLLDQEKTYEALFSVPEPGIYYIGIHCTSKEDQYGLWVKNIRIEDMGIVASSPEKVSGLSAEGKARGELKATVSFTMPSYDVSGNPIPSDILLSAEVQAASVVVVDAKPGEKVTMDVETVQGDNEISVVVFCNGNNSLPARTNVFTGVTVPAPVSEVKRTVSADMRSVTLTWEAPDYGEDDGYIVPEDLVYHIFKYVANNSGTSDLVEIDTTVDCEYTYTNNDYQEFLDIGVAPGNVAGICQTVMGVSEVVGVPYSLPMVENLDDPDGDFAQNPWLTYQPDDDYTAYWTMGSPHDVNPEFDDRQSLAIIASVRYDAGYGCLGMPRFTTVGESEANIAISVYDGPDAGVMSVKGMSGSSDEVIVIGEMKPSGGAPAFVEYTFSLPAELLGQQWVQLYIECDLPDPMHIAAFNRVQVNGSTVGVDSTGVTPCTFSAGKGYLKIYGCRNIDISVFDVNGVSVYSGKPEGDQLSLDLNAGVYLLCIDGKTMKTIVK